MSDAQAGRKIIFAPGEYLFRIAGCASCHTDRDAKGPALAGGRPLQTPFGTFFTPNITPDRETGIGKWTDAQFLRALKAGIAPDGGNYFPSFPYGSYASMRHEDAVAIKQYLFGRAPVMQKNRDHDLPWYLPRPLVSIWKWLYFRPAMLQSQKKMFHADPERQRGAYIATALAHCSECHTPRDRFGGMDFSRNLAGTKDGPDGESVPNITSDRRTGIGRWTDDELKQYLKTGMTPDGDYAGGLMAEVIDNGLKYLTQNDLEALVSYLRSVPKIHNQLKRSKPKKKTNEWE